jgi:hypothetical protein
MTTTHAGRINADMLVFFRSQRHQADVDEKERCLAAAAGIRCSGPQR